jgi:hypothetical protein
LAWVLLSCSFGYKNKMAFGAAPKSALFYNSTAHASRTTGLAKESFYPLKHSVSSIVYTNLLLLYFLVSCRTSRLWISLLLASATCAA